MSQVTKKADIMEKISAQEKKLGGTVVLVNPDGSEIEVAILNANVLGNVIECETLSQCRRGSATNWVGYTRRASPEKNMLSAPRPLPNAYPDQSWWCTAAWA